MRLATTHYVRPEIVEDAVAALAGAPGSRVLAADQTLINVLKHRAAAVELLVDVSRLAALRFIDVRADGSVMIGAATTYAELASSPELRAVHPTVGRVAEGTVDRQVRARGTIGGNVCFADPASNFPPLLVALDATCSIMGRDGARLVPASEFFVGMFRTAVEHGELLTAINLPPLGDAGVGYETLQLAADSWALARAAAWVRANGTIGDVRVVLGRVAGAPIRAAGVEAELLGAAPTADVASAAARRAVENIDPPSDPHASGGYRREMAAVMAKRALLGAFEQREAAQ